MTSLHFNKDGLKEFKEKHWDLNKIQVCETSFAPVWKSGNYTGKSIGGFVLE